MTLITPDSAPACRCQEVQYKPLGPEGGPQFDSWSCISCGREFAPRSSMEAFKRHGIGLMRAATIEAIRGYERGNLKYTQKDMELISLTIDEMIQTLIEEVASLDVESEPADALLAQREGEGEDE